MIILNAFFLTCWLEFFPYEFIFFHLWKCCFRTRNIDSNMLYWTHAHIKIIYFTSTWYTSAYIGKYIIIEYIPNKQRTYNMISHIINNVDKTAMAVFGDNWKMNTNISLCRGIHILKLTYFRVKYKTYRSGNYDTMELFLLYYIIVDILYYIML